MKNYIELKIKLKSLAAEIAIIRQQERKLMSFAAKIASRGDRQHWVAEHNKQREALREHRRTVVSHEFRHSLLAYGFLRGIALSRIERSKKPVHWEKVQDMIVRFGYIGQVTGENKDQIKKQVQSNVQLWRSGVEQYVAVPTAAGRVHCWTGAATEVIPGNG